MCQVQASRQVEALHTTGKPYTTVNVQGCKKSSHINDKLYCTTSTFVKREGSSQGEAFSTKP
jgi:hypothetical protein